jgi:hypothetical protein
VSIDKRLNTLFHLNLCIFFKILLNDTTEFEEIVFYFPMNLRTKLAPSFTYFLKRLVTVRYWTP